MSVSNYILNQRISALQYQIDHLNPSGHQTLSEVLTQGNSTGNLSIVNDDNTFVMLTAPSASSINMLSNTNNMLLTSSDLTFNGVSVITPPTTKTLINIISTPDFDVITSNVYYTSALKNGVVYMTPSVSVVSLTFLNALSLYNFAVLVDIPSDTDYYFTFYTNLNNNFISQQVYFSCDASSNLVLNVPAGLTVGNYQLSLPSFSYIIN
jgi:hypothetical protein